MFTSTCRNLLRFLSMGFSHLSTSSRNSNLKEILSKMPKEKQHVAEMQKQRQKLKEKGKKYAPGIVNLQVLGSGSRGAPRSLYIFTDQARYIFNCGEGTQRMAHEHKCKLSKLEHIFVTKPTWENLGGLPGLALTIQDVGVPHITLHGPQGTSEIFHATKKFVILRDLTVSMAECNVAQPYDDMVMTVTYVPLTKLDVADETDISDEKTDSSEDDDTDYYAHEIRRNGKRPRANEGPGKKVRKTENELVRTRITGSMAYVCKLKPRAGTLNLEKCVEAGVTPGPVLGQLKAGNDVTLPNGTVVRGKDVCSPDDPGPVFIVLECPSEDYLDSLVQNPVFESYQHHATKDDDLCFCLVHFTPEKIMRDPRYKAWMDKFSPSTHHLVINESNECMGSLAVHRLQHKLHLIHPDIFPFLMEKGMEGSQSKNFNDIEGNEDDIVEALTRKSDPVVSTNDAKPSKNDQLGTRTLHSVYMRPRNGLNTRSELVLQPMDYVQEALAVDGFMDALAELQTDIGVKTRELGGIREFPKVLMLGTGSCIPNKTRNTSGILLRINKDTSMLMDCGEGTLNQIVRFFGKEESDRILASIKAIYVSHLHADHHIGLIGLLKGRARVTREPALLLAPKQIHSWLYFYHRRFEPIQDKYVLVPNANLTLNQHELPAEMQSQLYKVLEAQDISTVSVRHCPNSFGMAFTHKDGYKITYSGDTMPCESLVDLGMGSDLLIHEATMEDDLEAEARIKLHSTTSQAIEIGKKMRAKFTLLTHFSQRYAKLPRIQGGSDGSTLDSGLGIAFDNMQVKLDELPLLPLFYPCLRLMFAEHCEELEVKAVKRQMRALRSEKAGLVSS